ncbi:MAG: hypothetical protein R3F61_24260 [Myxococcota bacterium]
MLGPLPIPPVRHGVRALVALTGLGLVLACGGAPATKPVDRAGFVIELVDGTIETDEDFGAEGDYDVSSGFTTQALSWGPIDESDALDDYVDRMWSGMMAIVESEGTLDAPPKPRFERTTVGGEAATGFETELSGVSILSTTWRCPQAGLQISVNTSGLGSARAAHEAALASVVCKDERVALSEAARGFRFVGDPGQWQAAGEGGRDAQTVPEGPRDGHWRRSDDLVTVSVYGQSRLDETPDDVLCETSLNLTLGNLPVDLDPSRTVFRKTPGGCVLEVGGTVDLVPLVGRLEHDACGGRGYVLVCLVTSGEALDDACSGVVACP